MARPPIARAAPSAASSDRAVSATVAPSAARAFATARPIPRLPPVTTATLPSRNPMKTSFFPALPFLVETALYRPPPAPRRPAPRVQSSGPRPCPGGRVFSPAVRVPLDPLPEPCNRFHRRNRGVRLNSRHLEFLAVMDVATAGCRRALLARDAATNPQASGC